MYDAYYESPNFGYPRGTYGRNGQEIIGAGLHISGGPFSSTKNYIMQLRAEASYNALIDKDGSIISLVPEQNAAYSHGGINSPTWPLLKPNLNPNLYTLSVARSGTNQNTWTRAQLDSTVKLLKYWGGKYDFPLERPYVFGHFEITVRRRYCPGEEFFNKVIEELAKTEPEERPTTTLEWSRVVAGSFRNEQYAVNRKESLKYVGIDAFIVPYVDSDNNTWHRVIAGSYRKPDNAVQQAKSLVNRGLSAFIVPYIQQIGR